MVVGDMDGCYGDGWVFRGGWMGVEDMDGFYGVGWMLWE